MFLTNGMYLPFCFLCPAQILLWLYLVWVHSQCGLQVLLFQHFRCRNLTLYMPLRCPGGFIGLASMPQKQPQSPMPLQASGNYAIGSLQVGFFFLVESPTILYIICLVSVLVSAFYFQVPCWMPYFPLAPQPLGFAPLQTFEVYPWQAYVQPGDGHWPTPGMHRVVAPSTTLIRGETYAT